MNWHKVWLKETAERVLTAVVVVVAAQFPLDWAQAVNANFWKKLALAAVAAALVALKQCLGSFVGNRSSGSFLRDLPAEQVQADPPRPNLVDLPDGSKVLPVADSAREPHLSVVA
jgi:ketopantoate reductase